MSMQRTEPSSSDYEREAEATRRRLAEALDELHDRLTPGHVLDEALSYARLGGVGFTRAFTNAARENPIPTFLIGAGCAMFLAEKTGIARRIAPSGNRGSGWLGGAVDASGAAASTTGASMRSGTAAAGRTARDRAGSAAARVREGAASAATALSGTVSSVADTAAEAVDSARSTAAETAFGVAESIGDTASAAAQRARRGIGESMAATSDAVGQIRQSAAELGETVQDYATSAASQVAGTADWTRQQAANAARQLKGSAASLINDQPLLVGALCVAIGAALAAALPKSRVEDELMGETADAVKETIGEVASAQYEAAKAVAGSIAEQTVSKAKEEGFTPAGVVEAARSLGDKAQRIAAEAMESAASAVKSQAGDKQSS